MKDAKEQQDEDIHLAARKGDLKEIQRILSTDPSTLNANGWMGAKPLYYAAESGSLECVQFLLNNGAQVNEPSNESKTTAIFGASTAEIAKLLLENGAELNVISQRGRVPLDYAIQYGHEDVVKVLIAHGANVNYDKGPNFFSTMIQWAIEPARNSRNNEALAESDNSHRVRERIVELLLKAGADPNQTNVYKQTAINKACRFGQLGIVELLLKYGANPNLRDISGDTAFDEAKEHTEILKVLEPFRKDIPLPPRVQCTPEELVQRLLKADADNCDSYKGCTDAEIASIEKEHGVLLPNSYKTFLRLIGQDAGDFLVDNHSDAFFRHLSTLGTKTDFSDILEVLSEKNKALTEIPEKAFVFLERLGAFYMYFVADGSSDDPPIFAITERDGIVGPVYENFWEFIQVSVEDFEFHTDPRNFS